MNQSAWLLCGTGILFCLSGLFFFYKNAFEKERKILPSVLLMIMGVIIIAIATAKYFNLA